MSGQIIKRGEGRYLVRLALGRDASGKRLYHNRTIRGAKKDAQRYLTLRQRELDTGTFVEASQRCLDDFLSEWLSSTVAGQVRARTHADYCSLVERYLRPAIGSKPLARLTPLDIQRTYAAMQERGLSARTVRYTHSVLHGALTQAVRWRLLATNPAKAVQLPQLKRREMRALTVAEAMRLLEAARSTRLEALWVLLLTTGLRPGEALGLRWSDVDDKQIQVQRSLVWDKKIGWQLTEPKTRAARRVVLMPDSTLEALRTHRAEQLEARLAAGADWEAHDFIFTTKLGRPLEWRVVSRRYFGAIVKKAGLGHLRPYDLRHSCATLLLAAGENVKVVSERLGHTSAALTLDVYSHTLPGMQQSAADRLESLLFRDRAVS